MELCDLTQEAIRRILSRMDEVGGEYLEWYIAATDSEAYVTARHNIDRHDRSFIMCNFPYEKLAMEVLQAFQRMGCMIENNIQYSFARTVVYAFHRDEFSRPSLTKKIYESIC